MRAADRRPAFARVEPVEVVTSPRMSRLADAVRAGGPAAVLDFWAEAARSGTPLVEPDVQGNPDRRTVTFLWRDHPVAGSAAGGVVLHANKFTDYDALGRCALERLDGTDLWFRSFRLPAAWRSSYQLGPLPAPLGGELDGAGRHRRDELMRFAEADPLNRSPLRDHRDGSIESIAELDAAPPQRWVDAAPDPARLDRCTVGGRPVWVHRPARGPAGGGPYPVLVLLDGEIWAERHPVGPTLDALVAAGELPPLVAVLVGAGPDGRVGDLACNPDFVDFLADELLPAVAAGSPLTADPARTIVAGQSFGGLAAAYAALRRPDRFGAVLAQSGSFWWPGGTPWEAGAEELTRRFARGPTLPVRFHLQVGLLEWGLRTVVRHLRDVLEAKGYDVELTEFCGGHDRACWRAGLADGLLSLRP